MKNQIKARLEELQAEYQKGQERLSVLEQETDQVRGSMLRISGAIQILEELLAQKEEDPATDLAKSNGREKVEAG